MLILLHPIALINTFVLRVGRRLAWMSLGLMVLIILLQVVMRYIFNSALAWPDEAARFLMLWMTGLIAPSAFRWGGFVAIDMFPRALPHRVGLVFAIILLMLSLSVLVVGVQHSVNHTFGFAGNFNSASLKLPLDMFGLDIVRVKLRYMYASLFTGIILLISVNIELILRALIGLLSPGQALPVIDAPDEMLGAD